MTEKLTPVLALDKRPPLKISSALSHDQCAFYRQECNFADVSRILKMTLLVNFFYQDLLEFFYQEDLPEYNL